ncbi:alginate export family protein [Polyangium mundeleinium]|uniref:Alginate export family protein n=1 Tax=Polyangium mundeleinium TaxID=2995306 RepID=A0ABT5F381_9BACT|nr:alginate export family protein [Polyangium mundeleinium]MDC0748456.1 alginate export family protein [Polyangium mundeleinium]
MTRLNPHAFAAAAALALSLASPRAEAQATPLPESIPVGSFTFRPSFELRVRGEFRTDPFDIGGVNFTRGAVLEDAYGSNLPPRFDGLSYMTPIYTSQWAATSRARLGLAVDRGPVTAAIVLQDARPIAGSMGSSVLQGNQLGAGLGLFEAYLDVHRKNRRQWFRLGRQRVVWGDGRLVGESDFTQRPRALDAARLGLSWKDIDVELLAALIGTSPLGGLGSLGGAAGGGSTGGTDSSTVPTTTVRPQTGSQLYGAHAVFRIFPLLAVDVTALARIVRPPVAIDLTPSDTYVIDARLSGDYRGVRYAVEGAYELGRISSFGANRDLRAFAGAGRVTWETALPWHLTFGAAGAYASGDNGSTDTLAVQTRFDPILPEERPMHGRMGLYAWSNLIEAGADIAARPTDTFSVNLGYRFVGLAEPKGRWTSASLIPIGASATNESHVLGHQVDATFGLRAWDPLAIEASYGLFLTGEGARNILQASSRGQPDMQHFAYLQAVLRAP